MNMILRFMRTKTRAQLLHEKSQARAKTWSNTLEGSRRKKAEEKRRKMELEELERQKVDAEEAKIQLDQRKATIDRRSAEVEVVIRGRVRRQQAASRRVGAPKALSLRESALRADRVKSFHSKMMLCDVIAEREAQMSLRGELQKLLGTVSRRAFGSELEVGADPRGSLPRDGEAELSEDVGERDEGAEIAIL